MNNTPFTFRCVNIILTIIILISIGGIMYNYFSKMYGRDKSLVGMSELEISNKFGAPVLISEFNPYFENRDDRIGIRILYPPKVLGSDIIIKEYKFIYKPFFLFKKRYITIWFHKKDNNWIVADTFWYDDRINF